MVGASQLALSNRLQTGEYSSEAELLAACRRRDLAAMEQLYLAHGPRLKSIAFHILRNRQDAEDAVQETFVKLYRGIEGFMGQANIGTWLCRIVINASYDLARKRNAGQVSDLPAESLRSEPRLPLKVVLDEALRRVNPRHRMVFLLFEVEGLRHSEIAAILEIPEGTSKAWLFEAKKELKRMLTEARP
ncbi:MAG TPA: RNA polymerase sigma factor [Candidatus Acidoferrales bacterium]|nr:RNA polymerase sigma factor [Candidatus Acidoferrales bacterium]